MTKLFEIIDIVRLALRLYQAGGYELAKKRLVEELERRDDKYTEDQLRDTLGL